jgi:hypothetical protein
MRIWRTRVTPLRYLEATDTFGGVETAKNHACAWKSLLPLRSVSLPFRHYLLRGKNKVGYFLDWPRMFLKAVSIHVKRYMAPRSRRPQAELLLLGKPRNLCTSETPTENLTGSFIICYIYFHTSNVPCLLPHPFQRPHVNDMSKPTCDDPQSIAMDTWNCTLTITNPMLT